MNQIKERLTEEELPNVIRPREVVHRIGGEYGKERERLSVKKSVCCVWDMFTLGHHCSYCHLRTVES